LINRAKSGGRFVDVKQSNFKTSPYMVNDVFSDAYDIPYMVNIVKLIPTMLTL